MIRINLPNKWTSFIYSIVHCIEITRTRSKKLFFTRGSCVFPTAFTSWLNIEFNISIQKADRKELESWWRQKWKYEHTFYFVFTVAAYTYAVRDCIYVTAE